MAEGVLVPVVLFDGEKETNYGNIAIYPLLDYKLLALTVGQMTGTLLNQISIYLVKNPCSRAPEIIPVNKNINFWLLCFQKNIIFLVVLKRLEWRRTSPVGFTDEFRSLLQQRRNEPSAFHHHQLTEAGWNLRVQSENFRARMARPLLNPNLDSGQHGNPDSVLNMDSMVSTNKNAKAFCEDCENANKNDGTPSFHHCVNDQIIVGFRTKFGPIARPIKTKFPSQMKPGS